MAKTRDFNTKEAYAYPSYFGSHAMMVDTGLTEALNDPEKVVCVDEHKTPYTTFKNRLDNGMADPNRYAQARVEYMCVKRKDD